MFILMAWSNENWAPVACFQTEESADRAARILTRRLCEDGERLSRNYFTVTRVPLGPDIVDTGDRYLVDEQGFPIDVYDFADGDPEDIYYLATVVERDAWASYTGYDGDQRLALSPEEPTND